MGNVVDTRPWMERAACRDMDPSMFFVDPPRGKGGRGRGYQVQAEAVERDLKAAKAVCATCPVRPDCREHARVEREPHGVWGGEDEYERGVAWGRRPASYG